MRNLRVFATLALACALPSSAFAREPVRARRAMVVAQEPNATDAGVSILKAGGNAVDAAVATAFALAVTHPSAGNIGGGGFLLARFASGQSTFIDFREMAPASASRNMYIGPDGKPTRDSVVGWRAAGVPGAVRGLALAHRKYGKLPWARLLQPALALAANGVVLSYAEAHSMCGARKLLGEFPESKRIFLNGGACFEPGDTLRQPELAQVLSRIAANPEDFYTGSTARILAEEMKKHGGEITLADLAAYKPVERRPLAGSYKGHDILTAPPPSSGGIGILQMLGMLEGSGYEKAGAGSAASSHYLAEVMRRYFADRSEFLGDSDFVKVPVAGLLQPSYIASRRASIDPLKATPSSTLGAGTPPAAESTHTTHLNVVDEGGNAVALTYTINNSYGNGVTVPRLGFLLNNEMDDFAAQPGGPNMFGLIQGEANAIAPGKRPLSAMTPTIVTRGNQLLLVLGAPGGPRIINGVLQVIANVLDFHMNVQQAVDQPRLHHQWMPDQLLLEPGFSPDTKALLQQRGHTLGDISGVGSVEAIMVERPASGRPWLAGAQNGRSAGKAAGY
ncbi:MAG: gamma-glutamyltransferase [Candidatus Solibacter usitatus]|nr:gamma-glutamyltransferase [Candidatus Solibacter usitatus]